MTITASVERLDTGSPNGCLIGGASTDLVGFYGVGPVDQAAGAGAITLTTVTSSTAFGFVTATAASAAVQELKAISDALRAIGLIT